MKDNVLYICSNHVTAVIGQMYGPKTTTPGGSGIKFAASVRLDLGRGKAHGSSEGPTGHEVRVTVTKNKVAPPFKRVTFDMYFDRGVDKYSGFVDVLQQQGIVEQHGGWYTAPEVFGDKKMRKSDLEEGMEEILSKICGSSSGGEDVTPES